MESANFYGHPYKARCKNCGKEHTLFTQEDNKPEYYTEVFVECSCGNRVLFQLPVN